MTEYSAQHLRHFTARVRGLHEYVSWLERDYTTPISEYLPDIVAVDSAQRLADYAAVRDMDGPHQASDGSWYLHRSFAGGVSWQAIAYAGNTGASEAERQARTWAAQHGCVIVPLTDATREKR